MPRAPSWMLLLLLAAPALPGAATGSTTLAFGPDDLGDGNGSVVLRVRTGPIRDFGGGGCLHGSQDAAEFGVVFQKFLVEERLGAEVLVPFGQTVMYQEGAIAYGARTEADLGPAGTVSFLDLEERPRFRIACFGFGAFYVQNVQGPWDVVLVLGGVNLTGGEFAVEFPTDDVEVTWSRTAPRPAFATWADFEGPRARHERSPPTDSGDAALFAAAGGTLSASVAEGAYGSFAYGTAPMDDAQALLVLAPDGPIANRNVDGHEPEQFAGGPGAYRFVLGATRGGSAHWESVAAWVDAPMPPGVQPRLARAP